MISAGGKEVGVEGKQIEERIRATAYAGGLRIVGPNCLGIIRPGGNLNASFASEMPDAGDLPFVSQSGAICTAILDLAFKEHMGFSHFVSIGSMLDVHFGPVILFGMVGIFTEVLKDRALGLAPLNRLLARRMMEQTRAWTLLQGYRNRPPADMERLEEMIIRLSQMPIDFPQIAELDMNPVLIKDGKSVAVDARILVSEPLHPFPLHLVISPYPAEDESHLVTEEGSRLRIRPVRPEDAPLYQRFFKVLSPDSIYFRFFSHVLELSPQMLARFTQIDYNREMALVALDDDPEAERMLGVARITGDPDGRHGEFAVVVGDPWHGQGIGSNLLEKCLAIAERRGFQKVHGIVLRENQSMLALGKKLGFQVKSRPDAQEFELFIPLASGQGGVSRANQET